MSRSDAAKNGCEGDYTTSPIWEYTFFYETWSTVFIKPGAWRLMWNTCPADSNGKMTGYDFSRACRHILEWFFPSFFRCIHNWCSGLSHSSMSYSVVKLCGILLTFISRLPPSHKSKHNNCRQYRINDSLDNHCYNPPYRTFSRFIFQYWRRFRSRQKWSCKQRMDGKWVIYTLRLTS